MSLKRETRKDRLGMLGRLLIFDSTSFCKAAPINIVSSSSSRSWDDRLVADFVIEFDNDRKVVGVADRLC